MPAVQRYPLAPECDGEARRVTLSATGATAAIAGRDVRGRRGLAGACFQGPRLDRWNVEPGQGRQGSMGLSEDSKHCILKGQVHNS